MKNVIRIACFATLMICLVKPRTEAQLLLTSDTLMMLQPYLRKVDTTSLGKRATAALARDLHQVTDAGSYTSRQIKTPALQGANMDIISRGTGLFSIGGIYGITEAAELSNRSTSIFIQNNVAGGGGVSEFFFRHSAPNSSYINSFQYTLNGRISAVSFNSLNSTDFVTGHTSQVRLTAQGNVGVHTTTPMYPLHVVGNTAFVNGKLMLNTTTDNGYTFRVNGNGNILENVGIGISPSAEPGCKLLVNGTIRTKRFIVASPGWADYVFDSSYQMIPLQQLTNTKSREQLVNKTVNSLNKGDAESDLALVVKQQQIKIEELHLYIIQQASKRLELQRKLDTVTILINNLK